MSGFVVGQRWVSGSEPELGLGLVVEASDNRVSIVYFAAEEQRVYAQDNSPLTRVRFKPLDELQTTAGIEGSVIALSETNGLICYELQTKSAGVVFVDEIDLSHSLQFNKPQDRLFMGQAESARWFSLRYQTWVHKQRLEKSVVRGLLSTRASLIPHQIYIAHEAANRDQARIMLADEVGLGKTIEAGLILQYRLHAGLCSRVIILVPDSLLHQWLVEMWRRFNLRFSLFDEERCVATLDGNPFLSEQLVLCSLSFFANNPHRKQQALDAGWDMLVVDEAHHLQWSEASVSDDYLLVEHFAQQTDDLILLTATPEQQGKASHFAQLRLLDTDRFYSYPEFIKEEREFAPIAGLAEKIINEQSLGVAESDALKALVDDALCVDIILNKLEIIDQLIDRHGTGRVLFRNSRHVIKGFPERELHCYPIVKTEDELGEYKEWLLDFLRGLEGKQVLLICQKAETVIFLQKVLRDKHAINAAAFHEGMTLVERDRAAAYFSDAEAKVQILLCSEIGSEGRNFQFVHHLVLLDLPENPDLLQQRIGRLDRIGQKQRIQIHVPYIASSRQHSLCRWYSEEGLSLFQRNSNAASEVYRQLKHKLITVCASDTQQGLLSLLDESKALINKVEADMHRSRDILLELNSCRQDKAQELIAAIREEEKVGSLWQYLEEVFECFGVDSEYHSQNCAILQLGELQRVTHFPWVPEDGVTVTVDRATALAREDMQYLTWEHPMLVAAMEMMVADTVGNAAVSIVKNDNLETGIYLLECLFVIECSAPASLQVHRFLPVTPIRVLIDQNDKDVSADFAHNDLHEIKNEIEDEQMTAFMVSQQEKINAMIAKAEEVSVLTMNHVVRDAIAEMLKNSAREIKRLKALSLVNATVSPDDLQALKDKAIAAHGHIAEAQLRLDAVRFIISS
ncbi:MAG: SNF2-related protein [Methyloprofundus sp.]|nr:SNF2-related protein [Methyloprofundus sp.]